MWHELLEAKVWFCYFWGEWGCTGATFSDAQAFILSLHSNYPWLLRKLYGIPRIRLDSCIVSFIMDIAGFCFETTPSGAQVICLVCAQRSLLEGSEDHMRCQGLYWVGYMQGRHFSCYTIALAWILLLLMLYIPEYLLVSVMISYLALPFILKAELCDHGTIMDKLPEFWGKGTELEGNLGEGGIHDILFTLV